MNDHCAVNSSFSPEKGHAPIPWKHCAPTISAWLAGRSQTTYTHTCMCWSCACTNHHSKPQECQAGACGVLHNTRQPTTLPAQPSTVQLERMATAPQCTRQRACCCWPVKHHTLKDTWETECDVLLQNCLLGTAQLTAMLTVMLHRCIAAIPLHMVHSQRCKAAHCCTKAHGTYLQVKHVVQPTATCCPGTSTAPMHAAAPPVIGQKRAPSPHSTAAGRPPRPWSAHCGSAACTRTSLPCPSCAARQCAAASAA